MKILSRRPVAPREAPADVTIDAPDRRLFPGCNNEKMAVADADFNANRATVTIAHQDSRETKKIYLSTAHVEEKLAAAPDGKPRQAMAPGLFTVLVYGW